MIRSLTYSYDSGEDISDFELKSLMEITKTILNYYQAIGIPTKEINVTIVKNPSHKYPMFCPKEDNPGQDSDWIILNTSSYSFWCQVIYQLSHELTHCIIYNLNRDKASKISWVEESICELMSLVLLRHFADNWNECSLSVNNRGYSGSILSYLSNLLDERGNYRLSNCHSWQELLGINHTSQSRREDRKEEVRKLYYLIKLSDIEGLLHYKDFVSPTLLLINTQQYRAAFPQNKSIDMICSLQEHSLHESNTLVENYPSKEPSYVRQKYDKTAVTTTVKVSH